MFDHCPGKGCECHAQDESECCCSGVDWRSVREVDLEFEVNALRQASAALVSTAEFDGDISTVDTADLENLKALL